MEFGMELLLQQCLQGDTDCALRVDVTQWERERSTVFAGCWRDLAESKLLCCRARMLRERGNATLVWSGLACSEWLRA